MKTLTGRTLFITGGSRGIGREIALRAARDGANVVVAAKTAEAHPKLSGTIHTVAREIEKAGGKALAIQLDVRDEAAIAQAMALTAKTFGGLDILVNNAGVTGVAPIDSEDWPREWERNLAVNLAAPARLVRGFLPSLKAKGQGRVVNIASTEGLGASYAMTPYTASKHGVIGLTRSLAVELGHQGVTVNCVCPGPINTGMTAVIPDEAKQRFARRKVPLQRYADPEELAQGILSLVLPASSYINGAVVVIDGGMMAKNDLGSRKLF